MKRHPVEEHAYLELKKKEQNEQSRKRKADESGENFIQTKIPKLLLTPPLFVNDINGINKIIHVAKSFITIKIIDKQ